MEVLKKAAIWSLATSSLIAGAALIKLIFVLRRHKAMYNALQVPGLSFHLLLGSLPELLKLGLGPKSDGDRLFKSLDAIRKKYGDVVKMALGPDRYVVIYDTQVIQEVAKYPKSGVYEKLSVLAGKGLVMLNGEEWQRHRRLLSHGFTHNELMKYFPHFVDHSQILVENMKHDLKSSGVVSVTRRVTECTLDIISGCGFGYQFNAQKNENLEYQHLFADVLKLTETRMVQLGGQTATKFVRWLNRGWLNKIDELLYNVINKRLQETPQQQKARLPDLLDLLVEAKLTRKEMRDELFIFYLAGHETTALTLTWTLTYLALHPDIQEELQQEISQVCVDKDKITFAEVDKLVFMKQTIQEILRLHPPASILSRSVPEDVTLGGYNIPKGTTVMMPLQTIHRDPNLWDAPEKFDPKLHFGGKVKDGAYFPFSFGPRQCIGRYFFWIESRVMLTRILQSFKNLKLVGEQTIPGITRQQGTAHPDREIILSMELK